MNTAFDIREERDLRATPFFISKKTRCGILFFVLIICRTNLYASAISAEMSMVLNTITDNNLKRCITEHIQRENIQQTSQLQTLKCHKKGIRSADGLHIFSSLQYISLYNNHIHTFDASYFTELTHINLAKNVLSEITLQNLPRLKKCYLFNNSLVSTNLYHLPELIMIKANNNKLENYQYKSLPKLEKIDLFNNALENIDIHSLPSLKYMDVRQNPMPDALYEDMDAMKDITILHDGNEEDWQ